MNEQPIGMAELAGAPSYALEDGELDRLWREALAYLPEKIIALDDDPTGTQTVHGVPVYTDWSEETMEAAFADPSRLVFILTNSRSFSAERTAQAHRDIGAAAARTGRRRGLSFMLISRGDSTLRGHWPLETRCLREGMGQGGGAETDGEFLIPFFADGGRFTYRGVQYVRDKELLHPAGLTEYARDGTFGYRSSNLVEWMAEKLSASPDGADSPDGALSPPRRLTSLGLDALRAYRPRFTAGAAALSAPEGLDAALAGMTGMDACAVDAVDDRDLKLFVCTLAGAYRRGKNYLFRTAASFVAAAGGIDRRGLLAHGDLRTSGAGLVVIGSHTKKTTAQLEALRAAGGNREFIEWRVAEARDEVRLDAEIRRASALAEAALLRGRTAVIHRSGETYMPDPDRLDSEVNLRFAVAVSEGFVATVKAVAARPAFVVAKGGITSSDIGVKALGIRKAQVLGQIRPGVPVWSTGEESRFPGIPYVVFPGNVGGEDDLAQAVGILEGRA